MGVSVLVIGNGGREHALAKKFADDADVDKVFVTNREDGARDIAENIPISPDDTDGLVRFGRQNVDVAIIGPEARQTDGTADAFRESGQLIFGAGKALARIESSKQLSKSIMIEESIPTAGFEAFSDYQEAINYIRFSRLPKVIKADGNAGARGVEIATSYGRAAKVLGDMMLEYSLKEAGQRVVIEDYLRGTEISLHAWSDGSTYQMFPLSQDHKYVGDGDKGPLTGGMGVVAPLPGLPFSDTEQLGRQFVYPLRSAVRQRGISDRGAVYYPGIMLTKDGPKALEYNMRFGNPEAQVYMRLLKSSLLGMVMACVDGDLDQEQADWSTEFAVDVEMTSGGYPGHYETGYPVDGLEDALALDGIEIYHANAKYNRQGRLVTNGGRVLSVTATAVTLEAAIQRAYDAVALIDFKNKYFRNDIGRKALSMPGYTFL